MYPQNLKSVAIPLPEIIGGTQKIWVVPGYAGPKSKQAELSSYVGQLWIPSQKLHLQCKLHLQPNLTHCKSREINSQLLSKIAVFGIVKVDNYAVLRNLCWWEMDRCRKWVISSRRADLDGKPVVELHKSYFICGQHFEHSQFSNGLKNRLVPDAVPTIFSVRNLVIFLWLLNIVMVWYGEFFIYFDLNFDMKLQCQLDSVRLWSVIRCYADLEPVQAVAKMSRVDGTALYSSSSATTSLSVSDQFEIRQNQADICSTSMGKGPVTPGGRMQNAQDAQ